MKQIRNDVINNQVLVVSYLVGILWRNHNVGPNICAYPKSFPGLFMALLAFGAGPQGEDLGKYLLWSIPILSILLRSKETSILRWTK